jgi:multidrug efflux pump subunit AcrA (membrane-fusion protein)
LWGDHWKAVSTTRQQELVKCQSGRAADRKAYADAQAAATAKNKAEVAADAAKRAQISQEQKDAYQNDLASLRADFDRRLRDSRAPQSPTDKPGLSEIPKPSTGADGSPQLCVPRASGLSIAETELRLIYLQNWIAAQEKVDPNAVSK